MKTAKLFFSIILVILATNSFSQQNFVRGKYFPNRDKKTTVKTVAYSSDHGRRSSWRHDLYNRTNDRFAGDSYEVPVVVCSDFVENAEVIYEQELILESWMIEPFESFDSLELEEWMVANWI